jgi:hypothetical protein
VVGCWGGGEVGSRAAPGAGKNALIPKAFHGY